MKRDTMDMEYADAPSGFVTLYNYKEPFMKFEGGHGLRGVLLFDGKTDKIQCHFCGDWHSYLPNHLHKEHNMNASDYKKRVGLNQSTALLNEKQRAKLIVNGLETRKANLVPGAIHKSEKREEAYDKIGTTLSDRTAETDNTFGTCPAQLLDRLVKAYHRLGRTPKVSEINFYKTLVKTYGSFGRACELAGLEKRKIGQNVVHWTGKFTDEQLLGMIRDFKEKNGREPSYSDCKRKLLPHFGMFRRRFGGLKEAKELAFGA